MALFEDPQWPRADAWLRGELKSSSEVKLGLLDVPSNGSITPGQCELAPAAIRNEAAYFSTYDLDSISDISVVEVLDGGAVKVEGRTLAESFPTIVRSVQDIVQQVDAAVLLGGDNSITRPGVHALGFDLNRCGLITLDAHLDIRSRRQGLTNGNPVRALLDDGLLGQNIVQIGIQSFTNSAPYFQDATDAGIRIMTMSSVHQLGISHALESALLEIEPQVDVIYFDLDLDVMDQTFAPGCPGARPGGLMPWQLIEAASFMGSQPKVRIMDLVELDPTRDVNATTTRTATMCLLAFAAGLLLGGKRAWA